VIEKKTNKPLKRFGQNYITDKNILLKIISEFNPHFNDNIVEIGPGRGALTKLLSERVKKLNSVEIDTRVIDDLKNISHNLNILNEDFLKTDLHQFYKKGKKIRIIGNIPYNITSGIFFKLIENNKIISDAVLMVQHEVGKRITGVKGTKNYGIFSVIVNYFCDVSYCFKISRNVFQPKPKVDSAILHLKFKSLKEKEQIQKTFIKVVKASFGNRRKMLKNSLSNSIFGNFDFSKCGIDLSQRAEDLDIKDFIQLSKFILKNQQT